MKRRIALLLFSLIFILACIYVLTSCKNGGTKLELISDCEYSIISDEKVALIQYYGNEKDFFIPSKVTIKSKEYFVTKIGNGAFYNNTTLESITIPDSVTSIGDFAFIGCNNLESVCITDIDSWCNISFGILCSNPLTIADNLYINGTLVTDLIIPDSVTTIGDLAFYGWNNLTTVTIGNSVTTIGDSAFYRCKNLTVVTIGDNVTTIGDRAFYECNNLTAVTIGDNVTTIEDRAFSDCYKLVDICNKSSLNIVKGEKDNGYVGCYALNVHTYADSTGNQFVMDEGYIFYEYEGTCYLLGYNGTDTDLVLPEGCNGKAYVIYNHAFENANITSITIPDNVTNIGSYAFKCCGNNLASITVSKGNTKYHSNGNCLIETESKNLILGCKNSIIPEDGSVASISDWAFSAQFYASTSFVISTTPSNSALIGSSTDIKDSSTKNEDTEDTIEDDFSNRISLIIPDSVTSIGNCAFYNSSLTSVTIPDSVTSIGYRAFFSCSSLTNVTIGDSVTSIGNDAFEGCTRLKYNEYDNAYYLGNDSNPYVVLVKVKDTSTTSCTINENTKFIHSDAFRNCSLTSITIPSSVTSIGDYAFYNSSLTSANLPDGVTTIGDHAFEDCSNLKSITMSDSVISVGDSAFYYCYSLNEVFYKGTEAEWSAIGIGDNNSHLTSATRYYYSLTEPSDNGNYWYYDTDGKTILKWE